MEDAALLWYREPLSNNKGEQGIAGVPVSHRTAQAVRTWDGNNGRTPAKIRRLNGFWPLIKQRAV